MTKTDSEQIDLNRAMTSPSAAFVVKHPGAAILLDTLAAREAHPEWWEKEMDGDPIKQLALIVDGLDRTWRECGMVRPPPSAIFPVWVDSLNKRDLDELKAASAAKE